jgi:vancomycin aglycone glucosyltransferase
MKVSIVVNGTRGDVQPMLALAGGLIKKGHEIIFCAPPENEDLVKRYDCPFVAFGPDYKKFFNQNPGYKGGAKAAPDPKEMKRQTEEQINNLPGILRGSDLILGVGFVLGVHTAADILGVPYRFVIFYPSLLGTGNRDPFFSRLMFGFGRAITNLAMKSFINKMRTKFSLHPIKDVWEYWMGDNVIVACDKELNAVREGIMFNFTQTGYMLLPSKEALPDYIEKFLDSGSPPVYIGFGSNPVSNREELVRMLNKVASATKQRLIVSKGWADLQAKNSADIIFVDDVPFESLFPRLAAIVYHGGTGTMASAARAGIPQLAFPFMADQFENRNQIVKLRLGPFGCDFKKLSEEVLSSAINTCLANAEYRKNATELSQKLKGSDGLQRTLELIEFEMNKNSGS